MPSVELQTTISPVDQTPILTRPLLTEEQLESVILDSLKAQKSWKKVPLEERIAIAEKWMAEFERQRDVLAEEISVQMGRPISQCPGEISGTLSRAKHLISIARSALADTPIPEEPEAEESKFKRFIRKEPVGVVVIVAPWNFPYMTIINSLLPSLLAGNSVILKPSPQTPSPAERFQSTFLSASLPPSVLQVVHLSFPMTEKLVADPRVGYVSFTGSVKGGRAVAESVAKGKGFKGVGLELGGKDAAFVRSDVDVDWAAEELVDGAMFNSGQSCCGIERIYVHSTIYDQFIASFARTASLYKLGDPRLKETNLGPVVSVASKERIDRQVQEALDKGARNLISPGTYDEEAMGRVGKGFVPPVVLVDVDHGMEVMMEETFGPVVGIQKVETDEEALQLMNDSPYGLTASIWTNASNPDSLEAFQTLSSELEVGTVFLNRCDFLDPALCWTGVKDSGRGVSLSAFGFDHVTRPKSIHMKIKTT